MSSLATNDPVGLWFTIAEEMGGGFSTARIARVEDGGLSRWESFPHASWDGVRAFTHLFAKHEGFAASVPVLRPDATTRWARARAVVRFVRAPRPPRILFKAFDASATGRPRALAHAVLSREETAFVLRRDAAGASVNSRLLWALDHAVTEEVAHPMAEHVWSLPVNMRGAVPAELANQSSLVVVRIPRGGAPRDVQRAVREGFERLDHWMAWDLMQVLARLGPTAMRRFARGYFANPPHEKIGSFSNFGVWGQGRRSSAAYVVDLPVSIRAPIAAATVAWAGRLSLNLQAHPAVTVDPDVTARWLARWRAALLETTTTAQSTFHEVAT